MKKLFLFCALVVAATVHAQPDLIARIHFAGADQISGDTNHLAFTNLFCSVEALALENQTLDRLSRTPGAWFKSKIAPGAGDGAAQLRPLLDDLLKSEWIFEMRDTTNGSPEYSLSIRLDDQRAKLWQDNLKNITESWTKNQVKPTPKGWFIQTEQASNLVFCVRDTNRLEVHWSKYNRPIKPGFFDEADDNISNAGLRLSFLNKETSSETNWLTADLDWPRLAKIFPALTEFDFPKIQMQVIGRGGNLQLTGRLALAQPLPPLEKWRLPASTIHQPLISFTAVRGAGPWLSRQSWMQPLEIQPQPDQLFIWALARVPFQTFAAEPVPDAKAALARLDQGLSANTNWQGHFISPFTLTMTNDEIALRGMPLITPNVQAVREPAGDFLVGGFFSNPSKSKPLPPELFAPLSRSNLVYYHWEVTAERLKELPQMSQLALMLTRHRQLDAQSAAGKWLDRVTPALGSTVTEVMQTAPDELAYKRTAPGGLTAIELLAFANWLEAPRFPAFDLRLPAPRVRPGRKPVSLPLPPPAAPAPTNP